MPVGASETEKLERTKKPVVRRRHAEEYRLEAVEHYHKAREIDPGKTICNCARELGINDKTLNDRIPKYEDAGGVTHHRARRRMSWPGMRGKCPDASRRTTVPDEEVPARPDLVRRSFENPVPTCKFMGDITCLRTTSSFIYLATVTGLCIRMVVGQGVADDMRAGLVVSATGMAWSRGYVAANAIFHSDYAAESAHPQNLHIRSSQRNNAT